MIGRLAVSPSADVWRWHWEFPFEDDEEGDPIWTWLSCGTAPSLDEAFATARQTKGAHNEG